MAFSSDFAPASRSIPASNTVIVDRLLRRRFSRSTPKLMFTSMKSMIDIAYFEITCTNGQLWIFLCGTCRSRFDHTRILVLTPTSHWLKFRHLFSEKQPTDCNIEQTECLNNYCKDSLPDTEAVGSIFGEVAIRLSRTFF